MRKGKLGVTYTFYATLAFVMALFGNATLTGLLLAFVLLVEKDEWTSRQCMQAFFLTFVSSVAAIISSALLGVGSVMAFLALGTSLIVGIISGIISILVLVFSIIGLVNVTKGKEANVPLLSNWAYKAFGYVQQAQPTAPVVQPMPPMQQQFGAPPPQQPFAAQQPPMAPPMQPPVSVPASDVPQPPVPPQSPA